MVSEIMTVAEVAEYLRINPQTVYRKAKAGEIPAVRIGRAIRFRRSELESWLSGKTVVSDLSPAASSELAPLLSS